MKFTLRIQGTTRLFLVTADTLDDAFTAVRIVTGTREPVACLMFTGPGEEIIAADVLPQAVRPFTPSAALGDPALDPAPPAP